MLQSFHLNAVDKTTLCDILSCYILYTIRNMYFDMIEMNGTKRLILFDIDGTLIHPGTVARKLLDKMVEEVANASPELQVDDVAGYTDPIILETALKRVNFKDGFLSETINTILSSYPARLEKIYNDHEDAHVYDDAVKLSEACKDEGWQVGLLSGNVRKAAEIKLKRFGLWDSFELGIFGDEAPNREGLVLMAEEAALEAFGESYTHNRMVLVGDTAQDAIAARANGVRSLIVCRRPESRTAIEEANPTWLVDSLDATERIILWLKAE